MIDTESKHIVENETVGGIPALRGFRKQFLHTLNRIVDSETEVIYPETLKILLSVTALAICSK